jgi:dihydroneopterin aldolase
VWDKDQSHECVTLRDVRLDVRVGVYPEEMAAPQPLRVDVELYRHRRELAAGGLPACLDYDRVYQYLVRTWPRQAHTALLEELAETLISFCLEDPNVEACRIIIRKPTIYDGRAVPSVEIYRCRDG